MPYKVYGLEALLNRLPSEHSNYAYLAEELRITRAGVNGEKVLSNIFDKYTFYDEHYIFHGLNLKSSGHFQMDTLFLSKRGAFILEMKNIAGLISFPAEQNQLKRTLENGQVNMYECPSVQLERNQMLLDDWFKARDFKVPIRGAVVFPKTQQQFVNIRENLKVLFPLEIPVYLRNIEETPSVLQTQTLTSIVKELTVAHQEYNPFPICKKYTIDSKTIKTGVRCSKCGVHGMKSISHGWACEICNQIDRTGHIQAILERFMLIGGPMTNMQCREFLHLSCGDKARRLMKRMSISYSGVNKGRIYDMRLEEIASHLLKLE